MLHSGVVHGTYALVLRLARPARIRVGALGVFRFPAGWYLYVGSALGGLEHRLARHSRRDKILHWHIDYFRRRAELVEAWYSVSPRRDECRWASAVLKMAAAGVPAPRFGSSDCGCPAHLVRVGGGSRRPAYIVARRPP